MRHTEYPECYAARKRRKQWEKQNRQCFYCREHTHFRGPTHAHTRATIDHVFPKSRVNREVYGLIKKFKIPQLVCACSKCNKEKADMTVLEWLELISLRENDRHITIQTTLEMLISQYPIVVEVSKSCEPRKT